MLGEKKGLKKQNKSFQKGRKLRGEGKGSKEGQQKGQKGRGHASGWQRRSGRPSRRSRYAQRQRRVGVRGRCPVSSQCDSEVHRRGVQGTEGGSGRKHKRKVTAACNPGTGTRRRREARQERCDGERRSTPGGQPPGRVRWRRAVGRAITTCNRGRVRRWRVAPGEHHRRPAGKLSG